MGRFSDSPRALYERLAGRPGFRHTWLVDPEFAATFPAGVEQAVLHDDGSPEARSALESADLVVASTHTEVEWDKPAGTTYLQTWHGTPLKRVHYDVLLVPPGRLEWLDRDIARWDALLSPNAASTPRLRQAFGYTGAVWETGYPRNDLLLSPDAERVRREVRAELGLAEDETAVLYAPTWRDDEHMTGSTAVSLHVDLAAVLEALQGGGGRWRVLTRLHNLMTYRSVVDRIDGVLDVSRYRDIRELHLAADVLVTDYSSLMFDFALTGKPIVLHAYDLERYRDEIRGFYFDLFPQAPGPVTTTDQQLVAALRAVREPGEQARHQARYDALNEEFGHLEDGDATGRVLRRLGLD